MKATILTRGIGMIYHKGDDLWKVLFPFDDCHTIKFKLAEEDEGVSLAAPGREIRVMAESPTSTFEIGERFNDFIDLTSDVSHKDGIRLKDGDALPTSLLTIENAKFSVGEHTFCRYQLLSGTHILTPPKEIAYSGKAEIEAESVRIEAEGVDGFPRVFNEDIEIIIDNTCPPAPEAASNQEPVSDLNLLYQVIEDVDDSSIKFTIDRDPGQKPGAIITNISAIIGENLLDNALPGQVGLPCNLVKISKPDNMG